MRRQPGARRLLARGGGMAGKIFINYRRDDDRSGAARIRDRLADAFGASNIFMDVDNLLAGQRFEQRFEGVVRRDPALALRGREAFAGVFHTEFHSVTLWTSFKANDPALRHRIHRVQHQIGERPMQHLRVGIDLHRLFGHADEPDQKGGGSRVWCAHRNRSEFLADAFAPQGARAAAPGPRPPARAGSGC